MKNSKPLTLIVICCAFLYGCPEDVSCYVCDNKIVWDLQFVTDTATLDSVLLVNNPAGGTQNFSDRYGYPEGTLRLNELVSESQFIFFFSPQDRDTIAFRHHYEKVFNSCDDYALHLDTLEVLKSTFRETELVPLQRYRSCLQLHIVY